MSVCLAIPAWGGRRDGTTQLSCRQINHPKAPPPGLNRAIGWFYGDPTSAVSRRLACGSGSPRSTPRPSRQAYAQSSTSPLLTTWRASAGKLLLEDRELRIAIRELIHDLQDYPSGRIVFRQAFKTHGSTPCNRCCVGMRPGRRAGLFVGFRAGGLLYVDLTF